MRTQSWFALAFAVAAIAGCSSDAEPKRLRLTGEALYDGQPIPFGDVLFTPDGAQGNKGPQGIAAIRDGQYDTGAVEGKGFAGGPTVIRVTGLTGPGGKVICEYELKADLPRTDGTYKIEVPKGATIAPKPKLPEI